MHVVINSAEDRMKKTLANLKDDFAALRTGRVSAALFDRIRVDCYGEKSPLNQVSNITIPEARVVVIQPWDKNLIGDIEKAIRSSDLSVSPSNDGKVIRINFPPLTGERRKEVAKVAKNQAEQARVSIRNIRRDGNDALKKMLKETSITEDEESKASAELQKITDNYINKVNQVLADKEKEIMED